MGEGRKQHIEDDAEQAFISGQNNKGESSEMKHMERRIKRIHGQDFRMVYFLGAGVLCTCVGGKQHESHDDTR